MKILSLDEMAERIRRLKSEGKRVALCHGCFDLLHVGHIKHLQMAKATADVLCVTVTPDRYVDKGPNRPFFTESLRAEALAAIECVDFVSINQWPTAEETLRLLRPTCYVKGQEFERLQDKTGKIQKEMEVAREVGAELRFTHETVYSSTKLLSQLYETTGTPAAVRSVRDQYPDATREFLTEFRRRHTADQIAERLNELKKLRVLVVGDGIVDEYHYCTTVGRSKKAPLVVYKYQSDESFAGGAFAVANHLSGLCERVHLVSMLGMTDSREEFIRSKLRGNVEPKFFYRRGAPTIVKRRYIEQYVNQKAFEVNFLNDEYIDAAMERELTDYLRAVSPEYDMVLVCDFGHGLITEKVIRTVGEIARFLAVNVQSNGANTGFNLVTKYRGPHFVCLDEPEARLAAQNRFGGMDQVAADLVKNVGMRHLIITLGKSGSAGVDGDGHLFRCPVFSTSVFDTVGAGDAFFAFTAPCVAVGMPMDLVSFIGNAVGALAVQIVCNRKPVEKTELLDLIHNLLR